MDAIAIAVALASVATAHAPSPESEQDRAEVAALDIAYQAAVKRNDAEQMNKILHDQYFLILGDGRIVSRAELLDSARRKEIAYEIQDEDPGTQTVRTWGDTAVVTACLRIKGTRDGTAFERRLWFSDTYVRTPEGWKYAFAQASLPLPPK